MCIRDSSYIGARLLGQHGALLGLIVGFGTLTFGLVISVPFNMFYIYHPEYQWLAERWAILYVAFGFFCGVTGEAHSKRF